MVKNGVDVSPEQEELYIYHFFTGCLNYIKHLVALDSQLHQISVPQKSCHHYLHLALRPY